MGYLTPDLTNDGLGMLIAALNGDSITFTKLVIGNGTPANPSSVSGVANPIITINLTDITEHDGYVILTGRYNNSELAAGFYMKELGVYAQDESETEYLYAYRYTANEADYIPAGDSGRIVETTISVIVSIGQVEAVSAILIESDAYATVEALREHIDDKNNPHETTKGQIGLSLVENYHRNNIPIDFTEATAYSKIKTGETLATLFGKIARLFSTFKTHADARNPHNITVEDIGAANEYHSHSTADITGGVLAAERGGTGVSTMEAFRAIWEPIFGKKYHTHNAAEITGVLGIDSGGTGVNSHDALQALILGCHGIRTLSAERLGAQYWSNGVYDMAAHFVREDMEEYVGDYEWIDIYLAPTATMAQQKAFAAARMTTNPDPGHDNEIVAMGTVPIIDIPVTVVTREGF